MRELIGLSKAFLVFIASTKPWRVSKTVLRVICTYISLSNRLLYLEETRVLMFDIATRSWNKAFEYPSLRRFEAWSATVVNDKEIVAVVAGVPPSCLCTYLLSDNQSKRQADFYACRTDFGLVYNTVRDTIYVFGGLLKGRAEDDSGALVLEASDWDYLPSMISPRYAFNPVLYGALVYLCGGGVPTIETFNPYSRSFTRISALTLPPDPRDEWETSSSLGASVIVILSGNSLSQFNPTAGSIESKQLSGLSSRWRSAYSPSAPLVAGNRLYVVDCLMRLVQILDIASGRLEAELRT